MNENAIDRKLVCAFIAGLISDDGERERGLEYIRNMPPVNPQPCEDAISRAEAVRVASGYCHPANVAKELAKLPPVTPQPKTGWNNHQIACMLADLFGDACACNYNGIDEWLGEICDFKDTCCPNPVGVACWEQFLKYSQSRYTECGYEVRDKNAMQEPKTGHWEQYGNSWEDKFKCSECGKEQPKILCGERIIGHWSDYCPNCGAWMVEPQERSDKE